MGRKFRTNKHKKLKSVDPNYTGIIKKDTGVNRQPLDLNDQEVPRKMIELFKQCDLVKNKTRIRSKKKRKNDHQMITVKQDKLEDTQPGMKKDLPDIPKVMKQGEYESDFRFIHRIQDVAMKALSESKMEEKFGIGEINDEQLLAEADGKEVNTITKRKLKGKLFAKKKKDKRKALLEKKTDEFSQLKDEVKFGEVAMEPPSLKSVKKIVKVKPKNKPGERKLLLKQNLNLPTEVKQSLNLSGHNRTVDLTKKRKDLSLSQRSRLENERLAAVQMYRQIKSKRNKKKVSK